MSKTTESKTFKQLKAVMKDVNGDNRQIIKTMQEQIDYLMEFIDILDEILKEKTWKVFFSKSFLDTLFAESFQRMYIAELPQRSYIIYSVRKIVRSDNI